MQAHEGACAQVLAHLCTAGGNLQESVLCFHPVASGDPIQVVRFDGTHLYPWSHLVGPIVFCFLFWGRASCSLAQPQISCVANDDLELLPLLASVSQMVRLQVCITHLEITNTQPGLIFLDFTQHKLLPGTFKASLAYPTISNLCMTRDAYLS